MNRSLEIPAKERVAVRLAAIDQLARNLRSNPHE